MKMKSLHALTTITPAYEYSPELSLSLSFLKKELPCDVHSVFLNRGDENPEKILSRELRKRLHEAERPEYFLIIADPWIFPGHKFVYHMLEVLLRFQEIDCVIPSDFKSHRYGSAAQYRTLRGFESFVESLQKNDLSALVEPYDNRESPVFLARSSALRAVGVPDNPFDVIKIFADRCAVSLNAYVHKPVDWDGDTRQDLLELIPDEAISFLDIGCSSGKFGETLKNYKTCTITGIEMNQESAKIAKKRLDMVIEGNALHVDVPGIPFDCVCCLDSLEHFAEPDKLLVRIKKEFLKPGGFLLLSIPNAGNISIVEDLLAGRWDYVPTGTMCTTHLRFFTLNTIKRTLSEHGFSFLRHTTPEKSILLPDIRGTLDILKPVIADIDIDSLEAVKYNILAQI